MTETEAMQLVGYLEAAYVRDIGEASRVLYASEMVRYPAEVVETALGFMVRNRGDEWFPPLPAVVAAIQAHMPHEVWQPSVWHPPAVGKDGLLPREELARRWGWLAAALKRKKRDPSISVVGEWREIEKNGWPQESEAPDGDEAIEKVGEAVAGRQEFDA